MLRLAFLLLLPVLASAQTPAAPRLVKTAVGTSGCYAYLPAETPEFEQSASEDGAEVYTSEIEIDGFFYSCIGVKFAEPFSDASPDEMEALLESYLDFLQDQFEITESAGYGRGHRLDSSPEARGLLDYWTDADGIQYSIMGWVDQEHLGVLIFYGAEDYPYPSAAQLFLNGWRFPE